MTDDHRQRLNVRAIRVTLASALRHAAQPHEADLCIARARELLEHARDEAIAPSVMSDIEALETQLQGTDRAAQQRES